MGAGGDFGHHAAKGRVQRILPPLILTRPEGASARFAAQVRAAFGDVPVVVSPLMAPVWLDPALPDGWDGVLFTSETGVQGLARLTARRGPAVCVGPRTAEVAQAAGWQAQVLGGDAERLVAALTAQAPAGHWLHARGVDAAGNLAQRLNAAGWQVTEALVYDQQDQHLTCQARDALTGADPVVILVFSPRSARLFVAQAGGLTAPAQAVAISPAAADPLAALLPGRVIVAQTPDAPGMLAALGRVLGKDGGAGSRPVYS
jgi:uroporphyrinogen-III synthase